MSFDRDRAIELADRLAAEFINCEIHVTTYPCEPDDGKLEVPGWTLKPSGRQPGGHLDIVRFAQIADELGVSVRYSPASGFDLSEQA